MSKPVSRQAHLAAMHMAQKALGLTADDAAALKLAVTGVASAAEMTAAQRKQYLAHLSGLQERQQLAQGKKPTYSPARKPTERSEADTHDDRWAKARVLWAELAKAGAVHTDTDAALAAYAKRQTGVDAWRFLNTYQINQVLEALKRWARRVGVELA